LLARIVKVPKSIEMAERVGGEWRFRNRPVDDFSHERAKRRKASVHEVAIGPVGRLRCERAEPRQRYKCNNCSRSFSLKTNTVFQKSKKSLAIWSEYMDLMFDGKSIRFIAKRLEMNIATAFEADETSTGRFLIPGGLLTTGIPPSNYWRHKILTAIGKIAKPKPGVSGAQEIVQWTISAANAQSAGEYRSAKRQSARWAD